MKKRLLQIIDYLGLSVRGFETACELQRGNISNMSESGAIGSDKLSKIIDKYPKINYEWLITGNGEMLKRDVENFDDFSVPMLPMEAVAGFSATDNDGVRYEDCEKYRVPEFKNSGVQFVVRVTGSSMYPKYSSGDILACKKITDILFFQWGKIYVIDSSQGVIVKRIYECDDKDCILLVSDNKEKYPPFTIPKEDIRSLSIVLGVIRME